MLGKVVRNMAELQVQMLGSFSLKLGGAEINDNAGRAQKTWLLLAYLFYFRDRTVTQDELFRVLWSDEEPKDDPANALRVMLHRTRTLLNKLGEGAGRDLIVRSKTGYTWNSQAPATLDADAFEALCKAGQAADTDEERLDCYCRALALYQGDFLDKYSSEPWVRAVCLHYHNLYSRIVHETLSILEATHRLDEAVTLCRSALHIIPFSEDLYYHLIRSLLDLGRQSEAIAAYEEMRDVFVTNFDAMPSEEIRSLYYEAIRKINDRSIPIELLLEQLQELDGSHGALLCDFDFFKILYYSTARLIARSGAAVHLALITVSGKDGKQLSKRSQELVMDNLQERAQHSLRRGDAMTRCSVSQFAFLFQLANFENSCMVCERIIKAFYRKYPHSPAELSYTVQAITPAP